MSHQKLTRTDRRAAVARLAQAGASNRRIAIELGISKDTVSRDLAVMKPAPAPAVDRMRHRAALAHETMRHLHQAVRQTVEARPGYTPLIDDATAAQWHEQLRQDAAELLAVAAEFRDYYPHLTAPTAPEGPDGPVHVPA
ncbi:MULTISPECIES: helix-turn-helix domain-containing protein [unclassified Streptomyces]|uniref:helix-turn-helix domain-containing protein n=1 Tax=unclassified Streptomyces TaxID=2593676 RepID=UPI00226E3782|nr:MULTISPECIES: helix-turn-helix domain-containing protein [unclassified Streptomyces]MCY0921855.1 helix-turn-helix domain-containing protein [Streptomyces sp. H27-G5]MCY0957195.1 helix-turn-helix domain-containing protein [Streptomyces sp. H27-H5]